MNDSRIDLVDQVETEAALDVEPILAIHRNPKGYIGFVRKSDPAKPPKLDKHGKPYLFENICSIRADELKTMFPTISDWLTHDSYFTVNAYHRAAPYLNKTSGLPDVWRKEQHLTNLTSCYADIDCGREEGEKDDPGSTLHWRYAQREVEDMADNGLIPQPSIIARSGRGVYVFWLLHDAKDITQLPKGYPHLLELYKSCNKALIKRLIEKQLPADKAAHDGARVLRVPGSIHRKSLRKVRYVMYGDDDGRGFSYSLPELAEFLDITPTKGELPAATQSLAIAPKYRRTKNKGSAPLRSNGSKSMNALRCQDLLTIQQWRGGFIKRGQKYADGYSSCGRYYTLFFYATSLCGSGEDKATALTALKDMAANTKPNYPSDPNDIQLEDIINNVYSSKTRKRWSNDTLCEIFGITADIARELDLKTIIPEAVKQERDQARPLQADMITSRRVWLENYIRERHNITWTAQKVVNLSGNFSPYEWKNRTTALQDLKAIGYIKRSQGGRPRRTYSGNE